MSIIISANDLLISFKDFLSRELEYEINLIQKILQKCKSHKDFYSLKEKWATLFNMNIEQCMKALNFWDDIQKALIVTQKFNTMYQNFPGEEINEEKFFEFIKKFEAEIFAQFTEIKRKAYAYAFNTQKILQQQIDAILASLSLVNYIGLSFSTVLSFITGQVMPKLAKLAISNPGRILISCSDEIFSYISTMSLQNVAMSNVYAGAIIMGVITCYSLGKRFYDCIKKKQRGQEVSWVEEFWVPVGVDLAVNTSVVGTTTVCALSGMVLGNFIFPGFEQLCRIKYFSDKSIQNRYVA